ncbi:zinc finger protein 184-like, partial [Contarinia nasturtii]|uniref:zinc finger protein 184-like n=1 Tax=Contarinia nasturtii TaxID=265458 RepID=UPI0012D45826
SKMLSWSDEMDNMLGVINRQVKHSLTKIKLALKCDGLSLNADFGQYFLRVTNDRIKSSYDEFEFYSNFVDQASIVTDGNIPSGDISWTMRSIDTKNQDIDDFRNRFTSPFEIIDSSDEEDPAISQLKLESSETTFDSPYDNNRDDFQNEEDGSYIESATTEAAIAKLHGTKSHSIGYKKDIWKSKEETENATKVKEVAVNDGVPLIVGRVNRNTGTRNQTDLEKRYKCQLCDYATKHNNLARHMRTHTGEKLYRCDSCRKEFTSMQNLKRHKVSHINEFQFHCRGCLKGFLQKDNQEAHEKVCKLRRYECHICKKFVTVGRTQLKQHMRKHNGEKPYRCEICMKSFTQKINMKRHTRTHTGEKPYQCEICRKGFTILQNMKKHK